MEEIHNHRLSYMTPESRCMEVVDEKGFTDQFQVSEGNLLCIGNQQRYTPEQVKVINFYRFEGISNPDDMAVIYVIETTDGRRGTLTDAFGVYADPAVGEFIKAVEDIEKKTYRGWTS